MTEPPKRSFKEMRDELAAQGKLVGAPLERALKSVPQVDEDLIPDVLGDRSEADQQIDDIIRGIDPITAYNKWIGKGIKKPSGDNVQISCPMPGHEDKDPSANMTIQPKGSKPPGTWVCYKCNEGGDIYDLAAIGLGHDRATYKDGKNFHDLRKAMAESFGYRFKTVSGTEVVWREEEPGSSVSQDPSPGIEGDKLAGSEVSAAPGSTDGSNTEVRSSGQESPVTVLHAKDVEDEESDDITYPVLNWKEIVPPDTFLWEYLSATSNDDSPEEYHFWHGALALGHAVGRNVYLNDTRPVYGNLLVCLLGGTGYGKSRSRYWLDEVIEAALPYRDNGLDTTGCKLVPVPASGENLINQFQHIAHDPSFPKMPVEVRTPVNGIVDYDEFASLIARAGRQGATLKQIIMAFSDTRTRISTSSNTSGTFEAYKPFCSITASTQPKAVRPLLARSDTASGFLNRWLFVGGPKKQREVMGGIHSSIKVNLDPAIERLKNVRGWGAVERSVTFTEDGIKEYEKFVRARVFPVQERDDTDLLTRLDLTMKRMILLFCINERKTEADAETVKRIEPLLDYLIDCYSILNAEIGITIMSEITTSLLRHIERIQKQTGRGASARDLTMNLKRKNYSPDMINKALKTMVELDWIDVIKPSGPGRPTIRYEVHAS